MFTSVVDPVCYASSSSIHKKSPGEQEPRTGRVMAALWTYGTGCVPSYREYLEIELEQNLVPGFIYYGEMYVSCADNMKFASNNLGMYFGTEKVYQSDLFGSLSLNPQINHLEVVEDTDHWVKISGTFIATESASFLVIGNFFDDAQTLAVEIGGYGDDARYFIDDILVKCMNCMAFNPNPHKLPLSGSLGYKNQGSTSGIHPDISALRPKEPEVFA